MKKKQFNRFCVSRKVDINVARLLLNHDIKEEFQTPYNKSLLLSFIEKHGVRILRFTEKPDFDFEYTKKKPLHAFPPCRKMLDGPDLTTYYHDHVLAAQDSMLTVALGEGVYTYCLEKSTITKIADQLATAVEFIQSDYVVYGDENAHLRIIDLDRNKQIRDINQQCSMDITTTRILQIEAISYVGFSSLGKITQNDVRIPNAYSLANQTENPELKVLNLAYKNTKLASSFSDGTVKVWDVRKSGRTYAEFKERGDYARGLQFYKDNRLVSGSSSGSINFYCLDEQKKIASLNTDSEVTDIHFNQSNDEMITTHGESAHEFSTSQNSCTFWKYSSKALRFEPHAQIPNQQSPILLSTHTPYKNTFLWASDERIVIHENCFSSPPPKRKEEEPFMFDIR